MSEFTLWILKICSKDDQFSSLIITDFYVMTLTAKEKKSIRKLTTRRKMVKDTNM